MNDEDDLLSCCDEANDSITIKTSHRYYQL